MGGSRLKPVQQPKAPNNTSQFLINDMEERDLDSAAHLRPRSLSRSFVDSSDNSDMDSSDEIHDPEFLNEYDGAAMERIEEMTRSEVNQELLNVEKDYRTLTNRVGHLKAENHRLKSLLQQNGIAYTSPTTAHPIDPLVAFERRRSASNERENQEKAKTDNEESTDKDKDTVT